MSSPARRLRWRMRYGDERVRSKQICAVRGRNRYFRSSLLELLLGLPLCKREQRKSIPIGRGRCGVVGGRGPARGEGKGRGQVGVWYCCGRALARRLAELTKRLPAPCGRCSAKCGRCNAAHVACVHVMRTSSTALYA
eukprot:2154825-Pleurochrysis_carterae.AAC.2